MTWLQQVLSVVHLEAYKGVRQKSTKILSVLYIISLVALIGFFWLGANQFNLAALNTRQIMEISLKWTMGILLPFSAIYLTASSFQKEFTQGTIKNLMLLPISKSALFSGKVASVGAVVALLLGAQFILSAILSLIILVPGGIFESGVIAGYLSGIFSGLLAYLGAFIALLLIVFLSSGVSLVAKNMGLVLVISYLGYVIFGLLGLWWPRLSLISVNSILGDYGNILRELSVTQLFVVMAYYTIGACAGYFLFEKKEAMVCPFE